MVACLAASPRDIRPPCLNVRHPFKKKVRLPTALQSSAVCLLQYRVELTCALRSGLSLRNEQIHCLNYDRSRHLSLEPMRD